LRVAILLGAAALGAEPLVTGFERFHAATPTAEGGRLLYNELGCVNCHGGDTGLPVMRGPALAMVTQRVRSEWLRKFIADPASVHPGAVMPQVLAKADEQTLAAIEHYLASLKPKVATKAAAKIMHVNGARGGELFNTLGCVACHAPGKDFVPTEGVPKASEFTHRSVGFGDLKAKYSLDSLGAFILDPLKVRTDGRMPKIVMDRQDSIDIAGYLLEFQGSDGRMDIPVVALAEDKSLAIAGRKAVVAARCAACHELPKDAAAKPVVLKMAEGGCLEADHAKGPRYQLSEEQRASLKLFLAKKDEVASPKLAADLTLQALNCVACHERDGKGGPDAGRKPYFQGDHNLGDTGRYPPPLTGVGGKLRPEWLAKVLAGENRVRPYLKTKMPQYGAATAELGKLLGVADARAALKFEGGDDTAGRKLMGTQGGAGCITCHRWGDRPSLGIQGPDLSNIAARLQEGWLKEYLINPAAYRPGTLMPSFWPAGKSFNPSILGGDTDKQIASIFKFVESANGEPEGFPQNRNGEFEIVPKDRPVVQRAFLDGVGVRAILVGFPAGVHLAYDGDRGGPGLAWKGRFFDAYLTWFSRFPTFEKPLGEQVVAWPKPTGRFLGYRLDAQGNPTFLNEQGGVKVEETYEGVEHGLRRTVTWAPTPDFKPTITHPAELTPTEGPATEGRRVFTYLWK
ncbi:MAG: c-type cytochrome, partial [Opitutales bacterium]|nr:c-type cytochrome [Opitutales bacterium]